MLLPCRCAMLAANLRGHRCCKRWLAAVRLQRRGTGQQHDGSQHHVTHQGYVLPARTNMRLHICQQPNPWHANLSKRLRDQYKHVLGQPAQCQRLLHGESTAAASELSSCTPWRARLVLCGLVDASGTKYLQCVFMPLHCTASHRL